jgi:drug/metabolite transporter (DMT)-like permease
MMTIGFIVWDEHWKGSAFALNLFKCNLASIGFLILSFATRANGIIFPSHVVRPIYFLMLSSVCGILVGDLLWLEGLRLLGARRVVLVDSIKPFMAAMLGWAILKETLLPTAFVGMAVTVVGVLVVSLEKEAMKTDKKNDEAKEPTLPTEEVKTNGIGGAESIKEEETNTPVVRDANDKVDRTDAADPYSATVDVEATPSAVSDIQISPPSTNEPSKRVLTPQSMRRGYTMACLNVVLDTYGSILTRQYGVGLTTWEINLVRFGFAGACLLVVAVMFHLRDLVSRSQQQYQWSSDPDPPNHPRETTDSDVREEIPDNATAKSSSSLPPSLVAWYCLPNNMTRRSWIHVIIGVLLVTFLAPTLSNYALFRIAVAIAITLGSVGPLYVLPLAYLLQHEKPTTRAMMGSVLAVAGIAILAFWKNQ